MQQRLLIVWVYFPAVGHFVEAIEVAANYHSNYPNFKIDILVNDDTVYELGEFCDWIDTTYAFNVKDLSLKGHDNNKLFELETVYDYVIFPKRLKYTPNDYPEELLKCNLFLQNHFKPKIWGGYNDHIGNGDLVIKEQLYSKFQMKLPRTTLDNVHSKISGSPVFSILLKGASRETIWPSLSTWKKILLEIKKEYPNAVFLITGLLQIHVQPRQSIDKAKKLLDDFIDSIPGAVNCYDIGLENQLAVVQLSHVFISPHTGFAFLAPCVGTPWLALSGGEWAEHMPAQMPFYNVLPKCKRYPCNNGDKKLECRLRIKLKQPIKCMANKFSDINEILIGIDKLLDRKFTYEDSFECYDTEATVKRVNRQKLWRINEYKKHQMVCQ